MANLTKDQVKQIVQNAPDKSKIIDDLIARGHTLEGYDEIKSSMGGQETKRGILGNVVEFGKGALKGIGSTAFGIGQLADKVIPGQLLPTEKPEILKPQNTAQKAGFGTEQIAEFLIPGGATVKGLKAVEEASALAKLSKLGKVGKLTSGIAKLAGKSAIGGLEAGAVRAAQTGGDVEEIKSAAKAGALAVPIGELATRAVGGVVEGLAKRTPTSRLGEMTRSFKTLQNAYDDGAKFIKEGGKRIEVSNPIKTLKERRLVPLVKEGKVDATEILQKLDDELNNVSSVRSENIGKIRKSSALSSFKNDVIKTLKGSKDLRDSGQVSSSIKKAEGILKDYRTSFGNRLTLDTMDSIRETMNKRYDPELRDVFRAIGDTARKHIYRLDPASREILKKEGEILAAKRFAEVLNGKTVKGGRLGGYVSSILGSIVGASTQIPVAGPIIGAMGGRALDRAIRGSYFKAPLAETAEKLLPKVQKVRSVFGKPIK